MGRKIFVSYKYKDQDVKSLRQDYLQEVINPTTVRDYVDLIESYMEFGDDVYKGERDQEDLSHLKDETIECKLRDKIYDSSVTIVLISPNMKEPFVSEDEQWIPWEIAYSLKEHTRNGRISQTNAMLAVVLPDSQGNYEYFVTRRYCCSLGCTFYNTSRLFSILRNNMFNIKKAEEQSCLIGDKVYRGYYSYAHTVLWPDFANNVKGCVDIALHINS